MPAMRPAMRASSTHHIYQPKYFGKKRVRTMCGINLKRRLPITPTRGGGISSPTKDACTACTQVLLSQFKMLRRELKIHEDALNLHVDYVRSQSMNKSSERKTS